MIFVLTIWTTINFILLIGVCINTKGNTDVIEKLASNLNEHLTYSTKGFDDVRENFQKISGSTVKFSEEVHKIVSSLSDAIKRAEDKYKKLKEVTNSNTTRVNSLSLIVQKVSQHVTDEIKEEAQKKKREGILN